MCGDGPYGALPRSARGAGGPTLREAGQLEHGNCLPGPVRTNPGAVSENVLSCFALLLGASHLAMLRG